MKRELVLLLISIPLFSCLGKPKTTDVYTHHKWTVFRNGTRIGEIRFFKDQITTTEFYGKRLEENLNNETMKISEKERFRGIIFINANQTDELWIFPKCGWTLKGTGIQLSADKPSLLSELEMKWKGTTLGS